LGNMARKQYFLVRPSSGWLGNNFSF
jgi:hypothetical protein